MLMISNKFKTERYQWKWNIIKRNRIFEIKRLKAFQNIVAIFKVNSIDSIFFVFICRV